MSETNPLLLRAPSPPLILSVTAIDQQVTIELIPCDEFCSYSLSLFLTPNEGPNLTFTETKLDTNIVLLCATIPSPATEGTPVYLVQNGFLSYCSWFLVTVFPITTNQSYASLQPVQNESSPPVPENHVPFTFSDAIHQNTQVKFDTKSFEQVPLIHSSGRAIVKIEVEKFDQSTWISATPVYTIEKNAVLISCIQHKQDEIVTSHDILVIYAAIKGVSLTRNDKLRLRRVLDSVPCCFTINKGCDDGIVEKIVEMTNPRPVSIVKKCIKVFPWSQIQKAVVMCLEKEL